ncbi:MAG: alpha/beta hydrolase [Alphaproteobacteria bacterium]|nr:alpha/beta hydrolase [Alphaproteobacteria bacterium]MCB9929887.1 alpha/beta hydrolase [Alphaproteobacteria bacterium]
MVRVGHLGLDGELLAFARSEILLEQLFASLRDSPAATAPQTVGEPWIEPAVGRYLHLDIAGLPHRLYFEEAGPADGVPLLCLHTAGADGRQYRGVLNDPQVTRSHRVIVFDMPWHGKSSPPPGFETSDYKLTTDLYTEMIMAVVRALKLDRPIVMGCSIGGRAVMHLALRHGEAFRAAIGLQSSAAPDPGKVGKLYELAATWRLDVHGGEASAGSVACLMAPDAPAADRWETLWHYMTGGPGIFYGDVHYYSVEGLMTDAEAEALRDSPCPIYMLTGDYDLSATPALSQALAERIRPAHFEVMHGLGHFPMSESPERFLSYLRPVLDKIAAG